MKCSWLWCVVVCNAYDARLYWRVVVLVKTYVVCGLGQCTPDTFALAGLLGGVMLCGFVRFGSFGYGGVRVGSPGGTRV